MIDPRELRIGNIVKCVSHLPIGFNAPGLAFSQIKEVREDQLETNEGFYKYRDISPLPLTEEILINSGGIKNEHSLIKFTGITDIFILNDFGQFYLASPTGEKRSVEIDSVHHFQNLHYSLTGQDIRIRITK